MGNLSAVFFVFASFGVCYLSTTLRHNSRLMMIAWLTLLAHHAVAFFNAFITPISTAWGDLYKFHEIGAGLQSADNQPYGLFLRYVYKVFGVSFWLGEEVSVFVYALSLLIFIELAKILQIEKNLGGCILLFGLLPSPLIHCSVTMREVYQLASLLGMFYLLIRLRETPKASLLLGFLFLAWVMFEMHQSLAAYLAIFTLVGLPWALRGQGQLGSMLAVLFVLALPFLLPRLASVAEDDSYVVQAFNEGKLLQYAGNYRNYVNAARSDYGAKLDTSGLVEFATSAAVVVALYFIAPLPWQVIGIQDYYAFFEVILRLALFYGFYRQYLKAAPPTRSNMLMIFWASIVLEGMWAIGTTNWGTATRHHVVAFGSMVLLGGPYLCSFTLDAEMRDLVARRERRKLRENRL